MSQFCSKTLNYQTDSLSFSFSNEWAIQPVDFSLYSLPLNDGASVFHSFLCGFTDHTWAQIRRDATLFSQIHFTFGPYSKFKRKKKKKSLLPQENNNKIITFFWAVKCQEVKILTVKYTTASSAFLFFFSSLMFSFTLWCDSHCAGCQNLWISGTSGSNGEMVLLELKLLMLCCGCGSDRRGRNLTTGIPAVLFVIDLCRISLFFCTSL